MFERSNVLRILKMFIAKVKITHKILILTVISTIVLITFAVGAILMGQNQIKTLETIYIDNFIPLDQLRQIQLKFRELEFRMTGAVANMVTPTAAVNHLKTSIKELDQLWQEASPTIRSNKLTEDKNKFEEGYKGFKGIVGEIEAAYMKIFYDEDTFPMEDVYDEWLDYKPLILKSIDKIAEHQEASVKNYYEKKKHLIHRVRIIVVIVSVIVIGMFVVITFFTIRSIHKPIETVMNAARNVAQGDLTYKINLETGDEMGVMAGELNCMVKQLNNLLITVADETESINDYVNSLVGISSLLVTGSNEQRQQIEQVATSSNEMSQIIIDMSRNAEYASKITEESYISAKEGSDISQKTKESITKLVASVTDASQAMVGLEKSSKEIGEISSVIKDIADQTNLLALNAAIEAARAGDHGRGFAVVADEVRKLAERTTTATKEIAQKIKHNQKESSRVITSMQTGKEVAGEAISTTADTEDALHKIVKSSENVMDMVQRIAAATEEQSSASEEVSRTMEQASEVANQTLILSENIDSVADFLQSVAVKLKSQVGNFKTHRNKSTAENPEKQIETKITIKKEEDIQQISA